MKKSTQKTNKKYVSEIDNMLAWFDKTHPKTADQLAEIQKYHDVQRLRDTVNSSDS